MKNLLFIAYHFPPLAGGGTFRTLAFTKYLPQFGWNPTIITTNTKRYWAYDYELLKQIPKELKIIRCRELDPFYLHIFLSKIGLSRFYDMIRNHFLIPDEKIGWIPFAYYRAAREFKKQKIDLIFSTSPSPCAHLIGALLKKRFKIPWVADYRDLWTLNPEYKYPPVRKKREMELEQYLLNLADKIIMVTPENLEIISKQFNLPDHKLALIYNGFDTPFLTPFKFFETKKVLTLTYTGTFYGNRNPDSLLKALSELIAENQEIKYSIRVKFIGKSDYDISSKARLYNLSECVEYIEFLRRDMLEEVYQKSDVFILIIPTEANMVITCKLFDYLSVLKPILAIIPKGDAYQILKDSGLAFFADPASIKSIKTTLLEIYNRWKSGTLQVNPNLSFIEKFHRRNLTKQLVELFNELT